MIISTDIQLKKAPPGIYKVSGAVGLYFKASAPGKGSFFIVSGSATDGASLAGKLRRSGFRRGPPVGPRRRDRVQKGRRPNRSAASRAGREHRQGPRREAGHFCADEPRSISTTTRRGGQPACASNVARPAQALRLPGNRRYRPRRDQRRARASSDQQGRGRRRGPQGDGETLPGQGLGGLSTPRGPRGCASASSATRPTAGSFQRSADEAEGRAAALPRRRSR